MSSPSKSTRKSNFRDQATFPNRVWDVFSVPVLYPISLTPRFSEVHGRVWYRNRFSGLVRSLTKTAKAAGARLGVVHTQLNHGVNERVRWR